MITTTLGVLVQAAPALEPLCALKLSAKSAYHLRKLTALVAIETAHFHESRNEYIKELGIAQPDGSVSIAPDSPQFPEYVRRVTDLVAVEVTIPWGPLTLQMLGEEKVSAADLRDLGPLLKEPEE
jgi:hypothetical protein